MKGYSEQYKQAEARAKDQFRARLEEGLPIKYTDEQYRTGLDAMPAPVKRWQQEVFAAELEAGYELSYGQMCRAFFAANEEYKQTFADLPKGLLDDLDGLA